MVRSPQRLPLMSIGVRYHTSARGLGMTEVSRPERIVNVSHTEARPARLVQMAPI